MPHVREIIPVVVLNHSLIKDSIASIHRHDCKDIEREQRKHGSVIYGPFDSVDLALKNFIDGEMEELGYTDDDVKVHPCTRQHADGTEAKEAIMATQTTQKTRKARSTRKAATTRKAVVKKDVTPRSQLDAKAAKAMDAKLAGLVFKQEKVAVAARRYAVKLVKKQQGLRTSVPPHTGLTEAQAKSVREALGV